MNNSFVAYCQFGDIVVTKEQSKVTKKAQSSQLISSKFQLILKQLGLVKKPDQLPGYFKIWQPLSVGFEERRGSLSEAILSSAQHGSVVFLNNLQTEAPFSEIAKVMDTMRTYPELAHRANSAYRKNLVYKDAFGNGNGGASIDQKRVLDLSPGRLESIQRADPALLGQLGEPFSKALRFFEDVRMRIAPKVASELEYAVGGLPSLESNMRYNYRMVDYYSRVKDPGFKAPPRCGQHRDFGNYTLIFLDRTTSGLEIFDKDRWHTCPLPEEDGAVLLFGYCTQIRSNCRISATLHRVVDPHSFPGVLAPRRIGCAFFAAPPGDQELSPVLGEGEKALYKTVSAQELRAIVGRRWRIREGTEQASEAESKTLKSQDEMIDEYIRLT